LLLYLTPDDWHVATDGGALRIHDVPTTASGCACESAVTDIPPCAGTLVLFDSAAVPHEVLPTCRERCVIVAWLLESRSNT
jgi:hypothetical protein